MSQLADMTGIAKAHVSVTVRELEARKIITRKAGIFGHVLAINKRFKTWIWVTESVTPVTETVTVTESVTGGYRISTKGVTESVSTPVTDSVTTKDNHTKHSQKTKPKDIFASQAMRDRFERFYAAYPRKKSRGQAEKAFAKISPDEQLLAEMISGIERAKKSELWKTPQYIKHPATWLNAKDWKDEVQIEYSAAERAVIQAHNETLGEQLGRMDEAIFSEKRAGAIRDFLTLSDKPNFHQVYFSWIAENCELPPKVGFDWLISRDTFTKIKGGQFEKRG